MPKKAEKKSRPSLNYREAYLRDALRWAMLVYMRREGLSYEEFPDVIEQAVRDLGGYDKKKQPINIAFRPDRKRYWITAKMLRNFLGPPSDGKFLKGERLHPAQIRVMRQFIEKKLPDYAQTFTPDGLSTQYGDFTSRLLFSNAENPAKQVFRERSVRELQLIQNELAHTDKEIKQPGKFLSRPSNTKSTLDGAKILLCRLLAGHWLHEPKSLLGLNWKHPKLLDLLKTHLLK